MKIDDKKWATLLISILLFTAVIGLGVAIVGGVIGTAGSLEVGSIVFAASLLCLHVVAQPKPHDKGEEVRTDDDQTPAPLSKKQRKLRKQQKQREGASSRT